MRNKKTIIKFIFIFIFILLWNLLIYNIVEGDEIWNYGFSNNLYNGLIPYKDFNMVITPFFPWLISIPYYIFGSSILMFHITGSILLTIMIIFTNKLLKEKYILILLLLFFPFFNAKISYNSFSLILFVLIIWCEKAKKSDLLIGFLLGFLILTKQTIGVCLLIPSIFYIKEPKKILKRAIGVIIPCIIFLIYLIYNNALNQFLNLCFLGLFDFNSSNGKYNGIFFYLTLIIIIFNLYLIRKNNKNIFYYYSLTYQIIIFPLFDIRHFFLGVTAFSIVYLLNNDIDLKINIKVFTYLSLIFLSIFYSLQFSYKDIMYPNNVNHFEYKLIDSNMIKITKEVNKYIKGHKDKKIVFLFGDFAYYFKIINDEKIEYIDLANKGNWGYNSNKKILNYLKKHKKNILYIINSTDDINNVRNQTPKEAYNYLITNASKIDSIIDKKIEVYEFK